MNMKKTILSLIFGLAACSAMQAQETEVNFGSMRKLVMAEGAISSLYVEDVDEEKIVESAIKAMLHELDPHSTYNNAEEVEKLNEPLQGNFEGIGVQFNIAEDTLLVIQTVSGGPSQRVGILAGDRIVTVNDTVIAGVKMDRADIMKRLRGPKGTQVEVGIIRRGTPEKMTFIITRDKIPVNTLEASYIAAPGVGYIRLGSFGQTSHDEMTEAMATLRKQGMKDLILDLQDNGGGYLQAAVDIANEFLEKDQLIVYTEGRRVPRQNFLAPGGGQFRKGRLVVLVNEYSASASEIVTGAVQDWDRGYVIGRRSFGKGLVQRPVTFPDGSMIRLTVAHYYTPSGRCVQKPYGEDTDYQKDLLNRFEHGEMMSADSIHFPDSLKYSTRVLGRTVYGGGGIMPDEFIPLDTVSYTRYHRELVAKGVINQANLYYVDNFRTEWEKQYPTFAKYEKKFEVTDEMLDIVLRKAEDAKVPYDEEQFIASKPLMKLQLKALIARDLWTMSEYFQIINEGNNDSYQAALRFLGK